MSLTQRIITAMLPPLAAFLVRILDRTLRYEVVVEPGAAPAMPPGRQVWCLWHRSLIACLCYFHRDYAPTVLISRSFDGELIARSVERLGYRTARGSSSRYGASGLLALARAAESGDPVVFTADGPRGPLYRVKAGAAKLAEMTGWPIGIFYAHPQRAWLLRSWDRFIIPKPFSRVAISYAREVAPPASDAPEALEATRLEIEAALERARVNAERHFDGA
jgi:hypothetical protein